LTSGGNLFLCGAPRCGLHLDLPASGFDFSAQASFGLRTLASLCVSDLSHLFRAATGGLCLLHSSFDFRHARMSLGFRDSLSLCFNLLASGLRLFCKKASLLLCALTRFLFFCASLCFGLSTPPRLFYKACGLFCAAGCGGHLCAEPRGLFVGLLARGGFGLSLLKRGLGFLARALLFLGKLAARGFDFRLALRLGLTACGLSFSLRACEQCFHTFARGCFFVCATACGLRLCAKASLFLGTLARGVCFRASQVVLFCTAARLFGCALALIFLSTLARSFRFRAKTRKLFFSLTALGYLSVEPLLKLSKLCRHVSRFSKRRSAH
jgi:hypothetical protein